MAFTKRRLQNFGKRHGRVGTKFVRGIANISKKVQTGK